VVGSVLVTLAGRGESVREKAQEILEGCRR
jgi:hypothetical protein